MRQERVESLWQGVAALFVLIVLIATLRPGSLATGSWIRTCLLCGSFATADALRNLALFLPIGFVLARVLGSGRRALAAVVLLTVAIEAAQILIPGRDSSPVDVFFNTLGGAAGLGLFLVRRSLLFPSTSLRSALVGGYAACLLVAVFTLGRGAAPTFPEGNLIGQWAPVRPQYVPFTGLIHTADIEGAPLPAWAIPNGRTTFSRFLAGGRLNIGLTRGLYSRGTQLVLRVVMPSQTELLMVGIMGDGIVVRPRTSYTAWRLFEPRTVVAGFLGDSPPGETVEISLFRDDDRYCIENAHPKEVACQPAVTAGRLWTLVVNAGGWAPTTVALASGVLLFAMGFPLGWWGGFAIGTALAAALGLGAWATAANTALGFVGWEGLPLVVGALVGAALGRWWQKLNKQGANGTDLESGRAMTLAEPGRE